MVVIFSADINERQGKGGSVMRIALVFWIFVVVSLYGVSFIIYPEGMLPFGTLAIVSASFIFLPFAVATYVARRDYSGGEVFSTALITITIVAIFWIGFLLR